jgi:uncharacterized protein (TIGR01777 family)
MQEICDTHAKREIRTRMKISITGATGFVGRALLERLQQQGHQVTALGRSSPRRPGVEFAVWDAEHNPAPSAMLEGTDAIVHLAGEPVSQRWNSEVKQRIRASRTQGTRNLVAAIGELRSRPRALVSASAIGYYGDRGDEILTEASGPGTGFLSEVCLEWENEAAAAAKLGLRVVTARIGIVLGRGGGALKKMALPFRMGIGGPIGSGKQWMSWIHIDDLISLLLFLLENSSMQGAVNAVAPAPVRNRDFTRALGDALHRPAAIPTPGFALQLLFGEMAEVILASERVLPAKARSAGFEFECTDLAKALRASL